MAVSVKVNYYLDPGLLHVINFWGSRYRGIARNFQRMWEITLCRSESTQQIGMLLLPLVVGCLLKG